MTALIGKQLDTVNTIKASFKQDQTYINHTIYLLGEMGVGKTYMSAYLASEYTDAPSLFVVPSNVTTKFKTVLSEFGMSSTVIKSYADASTFNVDTMTTDALIVSHRFFKRFIEEHELSDFGYAVIDEVHAIKKSARGALLNMLYAKHESTDVLLMTGTLFDASRLELTELLSTSHSVLFRYKGGRSHEYYALNQLFAMFLQYVSVSLNLSDLNQSQSDEQVFTVHPIDFIPMTEEERLNYQLVLALTNATDTSASNIIDNPTKSAWWTAKWRGTAEKFGQRLAYRQSAMLTILPVEQTAKYQAFHELLTQSNKQKVLVYVSDPELIETLKNLTSNEFKVDSLPDDVLESDYEDYFKTSFTENGTQLFFVNPSRIATGIDIPADAIIWYQLINNTSDTIQAQRRVRRMDSVDDVDVWYLAYNNTQQESLVRELSEASKANSATYAVQQNDAIAKVTGVLLDGIV